MTRTVPLQPQIGHSGLPADLAETIRTIGKRETPPETLRQGVAIITETLDEANVDVGLEDMYQDEPTRHAVHVDGTVVHVPCVMDAMIVALAHATRPIEILSEPPRSEGTVRFQVDEDEVRVTPERAVVSFGIGYGDAGATDITTAKETLNEASATPTICSTINAFPDSDAYDRWASTVSEAAVMEFTVADLVAISLRAAQGITTT